MLRMLIAIPLILWASCSMTAFAEMPFGRRSHEAPADLARKEEDYRTRRHEAEQAGAAAEALEALDLKLQELGLRRRIALDRMLRDRKRAGADTREAGVIERRIDGLKKELAAVRLRLRRLGPDGRPATVEDGGRAGSGAGSGSGH